MEINELWVNERGVFISTLKSFDIWESQKSELISKGFFIQNEMKNIFDYLIVYDTSRLNEMISFVSNNSKYHKVVEKFREDTINSILK